LWGKIFGKKKTAQESKVKVAFCNSCGKYKNVKGMKTEPITLIMPNQGIFSGTGLENTFSTRRSATRNVCSDCQAKEIAMAKKVIKKQR
jgi:hypothetical protein